MNLQPSNRRQDSPVRLGTHGYRLDGDYAVLQAELHVPPYLSGQGFGLELWACATPHAGGDLTGVRIAALPLDLPTPIGPHLHRVDARAPLSPPLGAGEHAMVLAIVSDSGAGRRVHDYANYARFQHFANPGLNGAVGYSVQDHALELRADAIVNPRPEGNVSGSLCLELWALAEPYAGGAPRGHRLGLAELGSVNGQYHLPNVARRTSFSAPPPGRWHVALLLREWTLPNGYVTRDHRAFDVLYEEPALDAARATPEPATTASVRVAPALRLLDASDEAPAPTAVAAAPSAPAPSTAEVSTPEVSTPEVSIPKVNAPPASVPSAPTGSRLLSVNAASLDELAKLPGVSLKIAKEIVKGRPFTSLEALLSVRGIGDKTLRRIKSLLAL